MPGVPSGRGCEACRKQKKKCDQAKPACSRCTRLDIPCIGAGQQRYKFKESRLSPPSSSSTALATPTGRSPAPSPSNDFTMITSTFISSLEITDLRYDINSYGIFLKALPKRFGTHDALDASVNAWMTAHSCIRLRKPTTEAFEKYAQALKALRICLQNPETAERIETLVAVYFIMICQAWVGRKDDFHAGHLEMMAHLLEGAVNRGAKDMFEVQIIVSMTIPVIIESFTNPRVKLGPWFTKLAKAYHGPPVKPGPNGGTNTFPSLQISNLAKIPEYIRHPEEHYLGIKHHYEIIQEDAKKLYKMMEAIEKANSSAPTPNFRIFQDTRTGYSLLLTLTAVLNTVLRVFEPFNISLLHDLAVVTDEVLPLAREVSKARPLGGSYMPLCLASVWASINDLEKRAEIESLLQDWSEDFPIVEWLDCGIWLEAQLESMRQRLSPNFSGIPADDVTAVVRLGSGATAGSCCIL